MTINSVVSMQWPFDALQTAGGAVNGKCAKTRRSMFGGTTARSVAGKPRQNWTGSGQPLTKLACPSSKTIEHASSMCMEKRAASMPYRIGEIWWLHKSVSIQTKWPSPNIERIHVPRNHITAQDPRADRKSIGLIDTMAHIRAGNYQAAIFFCEMLQQLHLPCKCRHLAHANCQPFVRITQVFLASRLLPRQYCILQCSP
jgi:hypothetical protein